MKTHGLSERFFCPFFWNAAKMCSTMGAPPSKADKVIAGVAQRAQALRRLVMDVNSRKAQFECEDLRKKVFFCGSSHYF